MRFLGTRKIFFNAGGDKDAEAYFAIAGITSASERTAVLNFFSGLKANNLWSRMDRLYLISPTSLSAALYCAKSLTQMTAVNSPTFATTGITFNGTTNYLNTNTPANSLQNYLQDAASLGVYNRSATPGTGFPVYMGAAASTASGVFRDTASNQQNWRCNSTIQVAFTSATVTGLQSASRESSSSLRGFINGANVVSTGASTSAAPVSDLFFIGANNVGGTPGLFSTIEVAFAYLGGVLSVSEMASFYTLVQAYQTALGRQV